MFPNLGSSEQEAAIIVGFFLPLLLAIPMQDHWPDTVRTLFSVAAYAAAGALVATTAGTLTGKSFWEATLEVLTLGVVGYQGVWKPSGVAPAIEAATSTKPPESQAGGVPAPAGPAPAGPPAGTADTGATGAVASVLEPQIGELLSASVKLLEHATQRIAGLPSDLSGSARPAAARPQLQTVAANEPNEVVSAVDLTDRSAAGSVPHSPSGPALADEDSEPVHPAAPSISDVGAATVSPAGAPHEHTTTVQRW